MRELELTTEEQAFLAGESGEAGAFTVDTLGVSSIHAAWCSLNFGATYCSCGADIAGSPIFGEV